MSSSEEGGMDLSQLRNSAVKKLMRDSHMCPLSALVPSLRKCSHLGDPERPRRPSFPGSSAGKESACNAGDPSSAPGSERSPREGMGYLLQCSWGSLVDQTVKNPPAMRLDPWVGKIPWRRAWQPTPVFLPGKSLGQRSLVGYSPWSQSWTRLSD